MVIYTSVQCSCSFQCDKMSRMSSRKKFQSEHNRCKSFHFIYPGYLCFVIAHISIKYLTHTSSIAARFLFKATEEPEEPVTLTDEEKAIVFRKREVPDILPNTVAACFSDFSIPARSEGFDVIDFLWENETASAAHLQAFISQHKMTSRIDGLTPGDWFKKELKEWQVLLTSFKRRQGEWKNPGQKRALLAKIAAAKKAAKAENGDETAKDEDVAPMKIDADDVDVFSVDDVMDIGSGEPLFANFAFEDFQG